MLGICSVGASHGSAGWPRAKGGIHNLFPLELRGAPGLVTQRGTDAPVQGEALLWGKGQCKATLPNGWHDKY